MSADDQRGTGGGESLEQGVMEGTVVHALSGWFVVQTPLGRYLCRPRGRLKPRVGAWRDVRDAERAEAAMDADDEEEQAADEEEQEAAGATEGARPAPGAGEADDVRRPRPARRGRQRSGRRGEVVGGPDERVGNPVVSGTETEGVLAGDCVRCRDVGDGEGAIEWVAPRHNALVRPPVANVDRVAVIVAWREPAFSAAFVDRLLVEAATHGCAGIVCVNKVDLLDPAERAHVADALVPFVRAGYPAMAVSAVSGEGLEGLRGALVGHLTVLAGPSGSGKSRLLGALVPGRPPRSGEVSRRAGRGRHTTRHVELLPLAGGGWVADTPGFSRLGLDQMEPEDLAGFYPEFAAWADRCRFRGCLHDQEPDCAVRAAVGEGALDAERHRRYLELLGELREARARRY